MADDVLVVSPARDGHRHERVGARKRAFVEQRNWMKEKQNDMNLPLDFPSPIQGFRMPAVSETSSCPQGCEMRENCHAPDDIARQTRAGRDLPAWGLSGAMAG